MSSQERAQNSVSLCLLGIAQDGGLPQAGCRKKCCTKGAGKSPSKRHPTSIGITGIDGSKHLFEATRELAWQLQLWDDSEKNNGGKDSLASLWITHAHYGHIDGLGLFGKTAMNIKDLSLFCSPSFQQLIHHTPHWQALIDEGTFSVIPFQQGIPISPLDLSKNSNAKRNKETSGNNLSSSYSPQTQTINNNEVEGECGFTVTPIIVPHRDELSDTHAMIIRGKEKSILFLPDHDSWQQTLDQHNVSTIRGFLAKFKIDIALMDGTFFSHNELPALRQKDVPHPTVKETLEKLGKRNKGDPRVIFIHLNHTNPLHNTNSLEAEKVRVMGWEIGYEGMTFQL